MTTSRTRGRRAPSERALAGVALALGLACQGGAPPPTVPVEDGRIVMGTVLDLSLRVRPGGEGAARAALERAFSEVERLEGLASRHDPESALARLNAAAGQGATPVDPDLLAMIEAAETARRITRGAFDARVGPLVELWTRAAVAGERPSRAALARARRAAAAPVEVSGGASVQMPAGASLDLGGIAKGFALDRIAGAPDLAALPAGLLSFGRSSVLGFGQDWRLRIEDDAGAGVGVVTLRDQALSMSSSLSQSSRIGGVRYGHVIDPRSGQPVRERCLAVVVAPTATEAEVLSTALLVLGEDEGRDVVEARGAEAFVLREDGSRWQTAGWQGATGFEPLPARPEG